MAKGGVHGEGGCAWQRGVRGEGGHVFVGGCAWQGACMVGGMHVGHVWQEGHAWHTRPPPRPDTTRYGRSMRGRYASYWNAFLFHGFLLFVEVGSFVVQNSERMRLPRSRTRYSRYWA